MVVGQREWRVGQAKEGGRTGRVEVVRGWGKKSENAKSSTRTYRKQKIRKKWPRSSCNEFLIYPWNSEDGEGWPGGFFVIGEENDFCFDLFRTGFWCCRRSESGQAQRRVLSLDATCLDPSPMGASWSRSRLLPPNNNPFLGRRNLGPRSRFFPKMDTTHVILLRA